MRCLLKNLALVCLLTMVASSFCRWAWSQAAASPVVERKYSSPVEVVKKALEQIAAQNGGRLPMLDGFVSSLNAELEHYERPYFQYRVHVTPVDANTTTVGVEAHISAWYADPEPDRSQYRALPSNGRLEADLLDRLQEALSARSKSDRTVTNAPSAPARPAATTTPAVVPVTSPVATPGKASSAPATLQQQLDAILAERQSIREKTSNLEAQIDALKAAGLKSAGAQKFALVKHSGVGVMTRMNFGGPVLFRAQAEDEFAVVAVQAGWAEVRLAPDSTAYIQADELVLPAGVPEKPALSETAPPPRPEPQKQFDLGFSVSREDVNVFSGEWAQLKGKKVLFVYAQPRGLLAGLAVDDSKLAYAKRVFESRYRTILTSSPGVEGVVVVFLGGNGGVAAATLVDIRQWVEGGLGDEAFLNRCSLDPAAEFKSMRLN
jgi:hypothetical protein